MDELDDPAQPPAKRSDVGYKRPPVEHQFKPNQPPPPRKKKAADTKNAAISEILGKILNEERRVELSGKAKWLKAMDLVIMRAWQEAEKGSATLRRAIIRLVLSTEVVAADQGPLVVTDRSEPVSATGFRKMDAKDISS